jgi:hypothetical protein
MPISRHIPLAVLVIGALAGVAALLVAASLRRPEPPTFAPTAADPGDVGEAAVGPVTYTIDASTPEAWRFFDFSRGSLVESPSPLEWDLAFRRFGIITNGGEGFVGDAGAIDLGPATFDTLTRVPAQGYEGSVAARDSVNPALERWYDYGFTSHLLTPKPRVYAIRTADGRFAKLEILSYYCPGALPGCLTFRYVYQGRGGPDLLSGAATPGSDSAR